MFKKNIEKKKNSNTSDNLNISFNYIVDPLNSFSLKCKKIKNNFNKLKLATTKDSLDFKFNFYKSLKDLEFTKNINISSSEFYYLKKFKKEKPFKVIECDKNVGTCLINTELYNNFVNIHLSDRNIYQELGTDPLPVTLASIKMKIEQLKINKDLSKNICKNLLNKNSKLGSFRLLAKLHKDKLGFRPIVNCLSHPTIFLCLLIDIILQPFVKNLPSFIQDSQHLIQKTMNTHFPITSKLFSCDFESLYTNIDLKHALITISQFISNNFKSNDITTSGFYEILKLIFENNIFSFNGKFYKQIKGIAMGAKCAPSIANLYVSILETNFLVIHRPLLYFRFIDDIFVILDEKFEINLLTQSFENLKLNIISEKSINFLDLDINLDKTTGYLSFSLYTKPTNTFSYLLASSNHPKFIFKNIPKSLFIRIRRICSNYSDFLFFGRRLTYQLINRGYNEIFINKVFRTISKIKRDILLPYKPKSDKFDEKNIFFKFPFDLSTINIKTALKTAYNSIANNQSLLNYKFTPISNMQPNLSSLFIHEFKMFNTSKFGFKRCTQRSCTLCKFSNSDPYIVINDFYLPIMADSNCRSKNILYILSCSKCKTYYIGQSISANKRLKSHIRAIRLNKTSSNCVCVHRHFNSFDHDTLKDFTFNIFNVDIDNKFKRLALETQLIHLFIKLGVVLINDKIPNLYYWYLNVNLFSK